MATGQRPNLLIVMTDHQRLDTVLPEHPCLTPNLTAFARDGLTFTSTFCPTAHCCPARATFWSGLYPSRHGVWNNVNNSYAIQRGPHRHIRMFSQDLRDAGYALAYAGKWHVSAYGDQTPKNYGWNELQPYGEQIQDPWTKWEAIRRSADRPDPEDTSIRMEGYQPHTLYGAAEDAGRGDEAILARGLEALPGLAAGGAPWCLFIGWNGPHAPYKVRRRYLDLYDPDAIPLPPSFRDEMADKPEYYAKVRRMVFDQLGEAGTKEAIRHFWAMCTHLDELFGKVLEALDATGQADNTLVLYCSDHGDYAGEHGLFHKQVPSFLGAYRVPAVLRWPAGLRCPGRRVDALVSLADFAPTFLDLAGVARTRYFTGRSLVPFLEGVDPTDWRREICMQCEGTENLFTQRQVVTHDHKYVYNGFGKDELYDLRRDPDEMVNLIDRPEYRDVLRDLLGRMWRFAYLEQDRLGETQYLMVNTAPFGPKEAFRKGAGDHLPTPVPLGQENAPPGACQ
ncbi:MAG: sulfatase-like hydrolase/transferase [Lentisphaeria bacterium]|nr:sulfatase-like hydrolase/transferase [Lentisphaeria bacterium]